MNTFATIEEFKSFEYVKYYTVLLEYDGEKEEYSETDKFLQKFDDPEHEYYEEFGEIVKLLKAIGERGAKEYYFRHEKMANALPSNHGTTIGSVKIIKHSSLRLYCYRVTDDIVILCNGDVKTTQYPQDCENVRSHFSFANKVAAKIYSLIVNGDLQIDYQELIYWDGELSFEV